MIALALDWRQTSDIHLDPPALRWEQNSIMGRHPRQSTINQYFFSAALLQVIVADHLQGRMRTLWQCAWIGLEVGTVQRNYELGIRLNF